MDEFNRLLSDYPYTDFHRLNLDWILDVVKNLESRVEELEKKVNGDA